MIIKTITCHDVYNHGATLQAYALMEYLHDQGHDVEIIDYKPDYLSKRYTIFLIGDNWKNKNIIVKISYLLFKFPSRLIASKAKIPFILFKKKHMRITMQRYKNFEELKYLPPKADAYIAGSDQIWNTIYENGRDPAFYLDFAPAGSRKISYAASFASQQIVPEYKTFVKSMVENFDFISVRETSGISILKSLGIDKGYHVLDPVFLLTKAHWDNMARIKFKDKYILVYDFETNPAIKNIVEKIAKKNKLKIYAVNNYGRTLYADKDYFECGPNTFLSLIKNADIIISNSFHATAFSIIFEKDFYVFDRIGHDINTRMRDLLSICGLDNRLIQKESDFNPNATSLDFINVRNKMAEHIKISKNFLEHALRSRSHD